MRDEIQQREGIEWQNIWWESANNLAIKRIALLGDSVTRGYRSKLNELLDGKYVVDICASSAQVTDSLLWREYMFFLDCSEWDYSRIVIQTGGQHGHARRCCEDTDYLQLFTEAYMALIEKIIPYCSKILLVSSTPCVKKEDLTEWNDYRNEELEKRNQITKDAAIRFGLPYIDIWNPLMEAKYEYHDYIHMKAEGSNFIAQYLSKWI